MTIENDRSVADHVIKIHRYRSPGEQDGDVIILGKENLLLIEYESSSTTKNTDDHLEIDIFEKNSCMFNRDSPNDQDRFLTKEFTQKYIHVAKAMKPMLTKEACDLISNKYAELRSKDMSQVDVAKTQPVTARTLESLIRLATAHAKARISKIVDVQDVEASIDLIYFAYFKEVSQKNSKLNKISREKINSKSIKNSTSHLDSLPDLNNYFTEEDESSLSKGLKLSSSLRTETVFDSTGNEKEVFTSEQYIKFKELLYETFSKEHVQSLQLSHIYEIMKLSDNYTTIECIKTSLNEMQDANQVMISDGIVYLI